MPTPRTNPKCWANHLGTVLAEYSWLEHALKAAVGGPWRPQPRALEDDPVYRAHARDFAEYHTRYVSPAAVRDALRAGGVAPQPGTIKR